MKINRRDFLKTTALTSMYFAGFGVPTFANSGPKKNLVVVMLRGGMDGLCAVPIKDDKNFFEGTLEQFELIHVVFFSK